MPTPVTPLPELSTPFDDQPQPPRSPATNEQEDSSKFWETNSSWSDRTWASHHQREKNVVILLGIGVVLVLWFLETVALLQAQIENIAPGAWGRTLSASLVQTSWWGVWVAWTGTALIGGLGLGVMLWVQKAHPSPYKWPTCYSSNWLGREAWRDRSWPSLSRQWTLGNLLRDLPAAMLVIGFLMSLVTGLQAMVAFGVSPSLNPHQPLLPDLLRTQGVNGWTMALIGLVNLGLPTGLIVGTLGVLWVDARRSLAQLWEHWTLYPTDRLRAQSPIWQAVLSQDWDAVNALPLDPLALERRSSRGGSLLTQAMLLNAPMRTIQHLLDSGCDPQKSWIPWQPDRSLDEEVRSALACDSSAWDGTTYTPTIAWDSSWRENSVTITWSLDDLKQLLGAFERQVLWGGAKRPDDVENLPGSEPGEKGTSDTDELPRIRRARL